MLKLEATLIATTVMRPRRNGWSPEHGVDFILFDPTPKRIAAPVTEQARIAAAEPVSFIEADDGLFEGAGAVRRYVSLAARAAEAAALEPVDRPLTRAWSSVARKLPGS